MALLEVPDGNVRSVVVPGDLQTPNPFGNSRPCKQQPTHRNEMKPDVQKLLQRGITPFFTNGKNAYNPINFFRFLFSSEERLEECNALRFGSDRSDPRLCKIAQPNDNTVREARAAIEELEDSIIAIRVLPDKIDEAAVLRLLRECDMIGARLHAIEENRSEWQRYKVIQSQLERLERSIPQLRLNAEKAECEASEIKQNIHNSEGRLADLEERAAYLDQEWTRRYGSQAQQVFSMKDAHRGHPDSWRFDAEYKRYLEMPPGPECRHLRTNVLPRLEYELSNLESRLLRLERTISEYHSALDTVKLLRLGCVVPRAMDTSDEVGKIDALTTNSQKLVQLSKRLHSVLWRENVPTHHYYVEEFTDLMAKVRAGRCCWSCGEPLDRHEVLLSGFRSKSKRVKDLLYSK